MRYDPNVAPVTTDWLALDEGERIDLVEQGHEAVPNLRVHAAIHAAVETQLAVRLPSVMAAAARLESQGLDRHDMIHAIGAVLTEHMWELLRSSAPASDPGAAYFAALDELTAESWRRRYE